jgi:hypothetical protein
MFFSHFSSSERPFCANNPQALRLLIAGCLRQVALVEFRSAGISGRVAMDGAMIGGSVVTTANPGGSGIGPGGELEAINTFPRVQRESIPLSELPSERRSSPTEPSPGMPKLLEKPEGKTPPSPRSS